MTTLQEWKKAKREEWQNEVANCSLPNCHECMTEKNFLDTYADELLALVAEAAKETAHQQDDDTIWVNLDELLSLLRGETNDQSV